MQGEGQAPHPSTLTWKIPWTEAPGKLQSMGSLRVGHNWATSFSLFTFHFHALEQEMATHSSVLAWRIPGTGEPGGLPSMGWHRVGHDWSDLADMCKSDKLLWFMLLLESKKGVSNIFVTMYLKGIYLLYNVVLLSAVQQSKSTIGIDICLILLDFLPI